MKKALITLMALAGVAVAADSAVATVEDLVWTELNITTPANGTLSGSNSAIDWSGIKNDPVQSWDKGNLEESWELTFTLDPSRLSDQYLFGTAKDASGAYGYTLKITSAGAISMNPERSADPVLTVGSYTAADSAVAITLQFVQYVDEDGAFAGGLFTLTVGEASGTYAVDSDVYTTFEKAQNNNVWTNGGKETFSGIGLKYAGSVLRPAAVPEPATATLSLLALAGLAARRRRK